MGVGRQQGWGLGHRALALKSYVMFCSVLSFIDFINSQYDKKALLVHDHLPDTPSTKIHPCWCVFVFSVFLSPSTHAEHENTPSLGCFCVQHLSFTPNMCQTWNDTIVGVFSCSASFLYPRHMPNMKWHPTMGVISCLVSFLHHTTHAEQENALSLVFFCVRHFSYPSYEFERAL